MRRFALVPLLVAACSETARPPRSPTAPPPAVAVVAAEEAGTVASEPVPVGKPGWKSIPLEQNGFWLVLDGLCSQLGIGRVGNDVVVHYGGGRPHMFGTDTHRVGDASFIGLRANGLESIGDPRIASPTGIAGLSLESFWVADSTGSRSSDGAVLHRRDNGTWKIYPHDQTNIHAWADGGVIGIKGFVLMNGDDIWVDGSTTIPPKVLYADYWAPWFAAFPSGDITLFVNSPGGMGSGPLFARSWSPVTKKITHQHLSMLGDGRPDGLVETAPDEIYVLQGEKVAWFDGTSWKLLGKASKPLADSSQPRRAAKGELWVTLQNGNLERSTPSGFVAVPTPEKFLSYDGVDKGAIWAVGESGKLYKRNGEAWDEQKLPLPAFSSGPVPIKAKSVIVLAPDDIVVRGMYWEKGLGWTEQELHQVLFRSKKQDETLRCNEPDPENNNIYIGRGFQSWPPFATAECKTPFVILSRRSRGRPTTANDWSKIRGALKGQAELFASAPALVELVSGDRTFVGARARDVESAKKIATLAAAKDRIRPEVLCAEPPAVTREIPLE